MAMRIEVATARIETLAVEAIVNAANRALLRGGGVDGAIRAAAGPKLDALLATFPALGESEAILTPGFNLPARFVIHTAAPIWGDSGDALRDQTALAKCYGACLQAAAHAGLREIAFPALGTGIYGWPKDLACGIAVDAMRAAPVGVERIIACCFFDADAALYRAKLMS